MAKKKTPATTSQEESGSNYLKILKALYKAPERKGPHYNYRTDSVAVDPVTGKKLQILFCAALSYLYAWVIVAVVILFVCGVMMILGYTLAAWKFAGFCTFILQPVASVMLLWSQFDMREHVKGEPGHILTASRLGGKQVFGIYFTGDAPVLRGIGQVNYYLQSIGNEAVTTICEGDILLKYAERDPQGNPKGRPQQLRMTGREGVPVRFATTPRLADPYNNVRLFEQGGPDAIADKYHDVVGSVGLEAPGLAQEERGKKGEQLLTFDQVIDPTMTEKLMQEGFEFIKDDEDELRFFEIVVNERTEEVINTETGYAASDFHSKGIVPDPVVMGKLAERATKVFMAETEANVKAIDTAALVATADKIRGAIDDKDPVSAMKLAMVICNAYDGTAEKMVDVFGVLDRAGFKDVANFLKEAMSKIPVFSKYAKAS